MLSSITHFRNFIFVSIIAISSWLTTSCSGNVKLDSVSITDNTALLPQIAVVAPTAIEFAPYWLKEQRTNVTKSEIDELKNRYQEALTRSVIKELESQGWTIVELGSNNTNELTVALKITNMRITAPDFKGPLIELYSQEEHGSGNFELSFSRNEAPLASFTDKRRVTAGAGSKLSKTNRVINQRAFDQETRRFVKDALSLPTPSQ